MLSSASSRMLSFAKLTLGGHVASSVGSRFFQQRGFFSAVPCVASSSTHGSCSTGALVRAFSSSGAGGVLVPASLPDLPYDYSALEPAISADIMKLHHSKHHQTYVTNFNATMEKVLDAQAKGDTAEAIALQGAVKFNGGGHVNHSIFWQNLCPVKDFTPPEGALLSAINDEFGSLDAFQTKFAATAAGVQGSGWDGSGTTRRPAASPSRRRRTRTRVSRRASFLFSASTFGSTRTTCSTRTFVLTT